jgi:hypothetical protein
MEPMVNVLIVLMVMLYIYAVAGMQYFANRQLLPAGRSCP